VILPKLNLLNLPISLIDTRDCFVFDPIIDIEKLNLGPGRENVIKKTFYFDPEVIPSNFDKYLDPALDKNDYKSYPVGCTTFENFFGHDEMKQMELKIEETEQLCSKSRYIFSLFTFRCVST
jgi:hypothetical protein